LRRAKNLRL